MTTITSITEKFTSQELALFRSVPFRYIGRTEQESLSLAQTSARNLGVDIKTINAKLETLSHDECAAFRGYIEQTTWYETITN